MTTVELKLDDQTLERIRRAATPQNATLEVFIQDLIRRLFATEPATTDPFLGMFSQEPDLMDVVTSSAMRSREIDPLRLSVG